MLKNLLILAFRNILKRKVFSFINIFGLALGVAACLVILNYVDFETSYDRFHTNASSLYRVNRNSYQNSELKAAGVISSYALGPTLEAEIPEVKRSIRTHPMYGGAVLTYHPATGDAVTFREKNMQMVDSTFLDAFTYNSIAGDVSTALDKPNSIVITKAIAEKYFGKNTDALGKILTMSGGWCPGDYEVTAVLDKVPQNSHFPFDALVPLHNVLHNNGQYKKDDGWGWNNFVTYIELNSNADAASASAKLPAIADKYLNSKNVESNRKTEFFLQSVTAIHTNPGLMHESASTTSRSTIYFFLLIAGFILAIAWTNYINLSTARAMERAHEVGIKKAIGVFKSQLIRQFLFESVLINFLSIVLAVLLALSLLPLLNNIIGKDLSFNFADYRLWLVLFTLFAAGSVISGIYPAFVLSSFKITEVLKGKVEQRGFSLRKGLVVFQFAASMILIAGTFGVYRQIVFMRDRDKGLSMEQMLIVDGPSIVDRSTYKAKLVSFKEEIRTIPGVASIATSGAIPGGGYNWGANVRRVGDPESESKNASIVWVDPDFIDTYEIGFLSGKNFNIAVRSDMESVIVNEAALKDLGLGTAEHALSEQIQLGDDSVNIVGVLKNYNWNSLKTEHVPFILKADTISGRAFSIKLSTSSMSATIDKVQQKFHEVFPGNPFDFYFLDDFFNAQYKDDQQFGKIFGLFAGLAIVISCLGLWGLASFTTSQRLKEIGIRKVLGASTESIMSLLSWQFMKLVFISGVIGLPLAWYGIDSWLGGFAFRVGVQWDLFVMPMIILSVIALTTVSLQIFKGARANPASVLRSE